MAFCGANIEANLPAPDQQLIPGLRMNLTQQDGTAPGQTLDPSLSNPMQESLGTHEHQQLRQKPPDISQLGHSEYLMSGALPQKKDIDVLFGDSEDEWDPELAPVDYTPAGAEEFNVAASSESGQLSLDNATQRLPLQQSSVTPDVLEYPIQPGVEELHQRQPSPTESQLIAQSFEFHSDVPEDVQIAKFNDKAFRKALREVRPELPRKLQWYAWNKAKAMLDNPFQDLEQVGEQETQVETFHDDMSVSVPMSISTGDRPSMSELEINQVNQHDSGFASVPHHSSSMDSCQCLPYDHQCGQSKPAESLTSWLKERSYGKIIARIAKEQMLRRHAREEIERRASAVYQNMENRVKETQKLLDMFPKSLRSSECTISNPFQTDTSTSTLHHPSNSSTFAQTARMVPPVDFRYDPRLFDQPLAAETRIPGPSMGDLVPGIEVPLTENYVDLTGDWDKVMEDSMQSIPSNGGYEALANTAPSLSQNTSLQEQGIHINTSRNHEAQDFYANLDPAKDYIIPCDASGKPTQFPSAEHTRGRRGWFVLYDATGQPFGRPKPVLPLKQEADISFPVLKQPNSRPDTPRPQPDNIRQSVEPVSTSGYLRESTPAYEDRSPSPSPISRHEDFESTPTFKRPRPKPTHVSTSEPIPDGPPIPQDHTLTGESQLPYNQFPPWYHVNHPIPTQKQQSPVGQNPNSTRRQDNNPDWIYDKIAPPKSPLSRKPKTSAAYPPPRNHSTRPDDDEMDISPDSPDPLSQPTPYNRNNHNTTPKSHPHVTKIPVPPIPDLPIRPAKQRKKSGINGPSTPNAKRVATTSNSPGKRSVTQSRSVTNAGVAKPSSKARNVTSKIKAGGKENGKQGRVKREVARIESRELVGRQTGVDENEDGGSELSEREDGTPVRRSVRLRKSAEKLRG